VFAYSGGFRLDFGGAVPQHYVNVSDSARRGEHRDDQWIVSQVTQVNGQTVLSMVDTRS